MILTRLISAKIVLYDLEKKVRFTVTQPWDRSPDGLAVSLCAPSLPITPLTFLV